jgi:hypothetical protein
MVRKSARPKGKQFYPVTMTLSQEQIDYLKRKPNASALIRKILDDLIASEIAVEEKLGVITLNYQLKSLMEKLDKLRDERGDYFIKNKFHWQQVRREEEITLWGGKKEIEVHFDVVWEDSPWGGYQPKPLDTEEAKVAFRVLQDYDKVLNHIESQIAEIKQKILQS